MTATNSKRLLIESWRSVPHSYSIVNHYQCVELLRRRDVELFHHDAPYIIPTWKKAKGLFDAESEAAVEAIADLPAGAAADATLRISFPYNFAPAKKTRLFVFGTAEFLCVPAEFILGERTLEAAIAENPDVQIITPSNWSREGFLNSGADSKNVHVVPHGVDPKVFYPFDEAERARWRQELNWKEFMFVSIGAMISSKGIFDLLKAFAVVAAKHPAVRLMLKGADALYDSESMFRAQARRLSEAERNLIEPRLVYRGQTFTATDMARIYQIGDAYVSPYWGEGFNLPVLEAAACGMPVICTAGGSTDDFTHPDFALRIPAGMTPTRQFPGGRMLQPELDALISHMLAVVEQPQIRARAHATGPKFVQENFTWKHAVDRLLEVIFPATV